ncbi:Glucose-repressible alcohol dehydrogenase transcriptional effector [Balamuthia mandrillaris]
MGDPSSATTSVWGTPLTGARQYATPAPSASSPASFFGLGNNRKRGASSTPPSSSGSSSMGGGGSGGGSWGATQPPPSPSPSPPPVAVSPSRHSSNAALGRGAGPPSPFHHHHQWPPPHSQHHHQQQHRFYGSGNSYTLPSPSPSPPPSSSSSSPPSAASSFSASSSSFNQQTQQTPLHQQQSQTLIAQRAAVGSGGGSSSSSSASFITRQYQPQPQQPQHPHRERSRSGGGSAPPLLFPSLSQHHHQQAQQQQHSFGNNGRATPGARENGIDGATTTSPSAFEMLLAAQSQYERELLLAGGSGGGSGLQTFSFVDRGEQQAGGRFDYAILEDHLQSSLSTNNLNDGENVMMMRMRNATMSAPVTTPIPMIDEEEAEEERKWHEVQMQSIAEGVAMPSLSPPLNPQASPSSSGAAEYEAINNADDKRQVVVETWTALDLSRMNLPVLNPQLSIYTHLTVLWLNNNKLTSLPEVLFHKLTNLTRLNLSSNLLTRLPDSIGRLIRLEELNLAHNMLQELPLLMGRLYRLKRLRLENNPLLSPPQVVLQQSVDHIVGFLRERMPMPPPPPERPWLTINTDYENRIKLRVLCYNILAEKYAVPELLGYCPKHFLNNEYRKNRILQEVLSYDCDFLALQEVESKHYLSFYQPEMRKAGYEGIFKPKSRARTMGDIGSVDGCVIFYKPDKFELLDEYWIEYQSSSIKRYEKEFPGCSEALDRLITKDQIAIALAFRCLSSAKTKKNKLRTSSNGLANGATTAEGKQKDSETDDEEDENEDEEDVEENKAREAEEEPIVMVVNTHIHWDPAFADVKLMQVCMLLEELDNIIRASAKSNTKTKNVTKKQNGGEEGEDEEGEGKGADHDGSNSGEHDGDSNTVSHGYSTSLHSKCDYTNVPIIICGDFNSLPDSGVYEFLKAGKLEGSHSDFGPYDYGRYTKLGLSHKLSLDSAYASVGEPAFTNFTDNFQGCLDYIFYTQEHLEVLKVLRPVDEAVITSQVGALPNAYMCSDHIPLVTELALRRKQQHLLDRNTIDNNNVNNRRWSTKGRRGWPTMLSFGGEEEEEEEREGERGGGHRWSTRNRSRSGSGNDGGELLNGGGSWTTSSFSARQQQQGRGGGGFRKW